MRGYRDEFRLDNNLLELGDAMSFHDKAANRAATMGKRSSEFRSAAQRHAKATWIFLITSGVVWYFWKWQYATIPALIGIISAFQSISSTMIAERIERIESSLNP